MYGAVTGGFGLRPSAVKRATSQLLPGKSQGFRTDRRADSKIGLRNQTVEFSSNGIDLSRGLGPQKNPEKPGYSYTQIPGDIAPGCLVDQQEIRLELDGERDGLCLPVIHPLFKRLHTQWIRWSSHNKECPVQIGVKIRRGADFLLHRIGQDNLSEKRSEELCSPDLVEVGDGRRVADDDQLPYSSSSAAMSA